MRKSKARPFAKWGFLRHSAAFCTWWATPPTTMLHDAALALTRWTLLASLANAVRSSPLDALVGSPRGLKGHLCLVSTNEPGDQRSFCVSLSQSTHLKRGCESGGGCKACKPAY